MEDHNKQEGHSHDPSKWADKLWRYYPIDYHPRNYHRLTSWWLDKIPLLGDRILEVGCWSSLALIWLKKEFPDKFVMGVDINELVVHFAQTRVFFWEADVPIFCADGFNLKDFNDQEFDVIFHDGLAEHFGEEERVRLLKEHLRVAKNVLFTVPLACSLGKGGYGDELKITEDGWESFTRKYFIVEETFKNEHSWGAIIVGVHDD
ncbi:MAG: class I SAM-dependent methyltransferase [Candidatus Daviesbacteria bacterium]|nr:class I SAM-dependent methyltransferase [Candidatus Daviesbacteria bacterium]